MYTIYHELQGPTSIEHACWGRLIPGNSQAQLILARRSVIDIYEVGTNGNLTINEVATSSTRAQLRLLLTHQLYDTIASLNIVTLTGSAASAVARVPVIQAIFLTFRDAKACLIALDPFSMRLVTLGMLNFEEGSIGPGCYIQAKRRHMVQSGLAATATARIDPDGRCALMMASDEQLAVMPFKRELEGLEDIDWSSDDIELEETILNAELSQDESGKVSAEQEKLTRSVLGKPFLIDLVDITTGMDGPGTGIGGGMGVTDMAFLHGYPLAPVICLLVHPRHTTTGRFRSLPHTGVLVAVSLDPAAQHSSSNVAPVVWMREGLPYDAYAVIPLPTPLGGVVVLTPSAVLYFNGRERYVGLGLNGFALHTVDSKSKYRLDANATHTKDAHKGCQSLDAVRWTLLSPTSILTVDMHGTASIIQLHVHGATGAGGEVHHLTMNPAPFRIPAAASLAYLPAPARLRHGFAAATLGIDPTLAISSRLGEQWCAGLLFQASRNADSLLSLTIAMPSDCKAHQESNNTVIEDGSKVEVITAADALPVPMEEEEEGNQEEDDEDALLYGGPSKKRARVAISTDETTIISTTPSITATTTSTNVLTTTLDDDDDAALYGGAPTLSASLASTATAAIIKSSTTSSTPSFTLGTAGSSSNPSSTLLSLQLFPLDSLPSIAPVVSATIGRSERIINDEDDEPPSAPPPTEVALACGRGPSSSVAVVHRSLRFMVASQLRLAGCTGIWSLEFPPSTTVQPIEGDEAVSSVARGLLLVATPLGTRVLAIYTEEGLAEVASTATSLLTTGIQTLNASIMTSSYGNVIAQVYNQGIRICETTSSASLIQECLIHTSIAKGGLGGDETSTITSIDFTGSYGLVRLSNGSVRLLTLKQSKQGKLQITVSMPTENGYITPMSTPSPSHAPLPVAITASCLYTDVYGTLRSSIDEEVELSQLTTPTVYAFLVRRDGSFDIYQVSSWKRVWYTPPCAHLGAHMLLNHENEGTVDSNNVSNVNGSAFASEPCSDNTSSNQNKWHPIPKSFIRDISVISVPGTPHTLGLILVNARDDVYTYTLQCGIEISGPATSTIDSISTNTAAVTTNNETPAFAIPRNSAAIKRQKREQILKAAAAGGPSTISTLLSRISAPIQSIDGSRPDPETARFLDEGLPVQVTRATTARFLRVLQPSVLITRSTPTDYEAPSPESLEHIWKSWSSPRIRPFTNACGWTGVAILTPFPIWLFCVRGTILGLPMSLPDVTGVAGPTALVGDHASHFPNPTTAFSSFNAPFCPNGFVIAHQGFVQFGLFPRPQWPVHSSLIDTTSIEGEGLVDFTPIPTSLVACSDGSPLPLGDGLAALSIARHSAMTICDEQTDFLFDGSLSPTGKSVTITSVTASPQPTQPPLGTPIVASITPGPGRLVINYKHSISTSILPGAAALADGSVSGSGDPSAWYLTSSQGSVSCVTYCEGVSNARGSAMLMEWSRRRVDAAALANDPVPLPPTAAQLQCCIQPLYAACISFPIVRNPTLERERLIAEVQSKGGEHDQIDSGEHRNTAPMPLQYSENHSDPSWDKAVDTFGASGSADTPPLYGCQHAVALLYGSSNQELGAGWSAADAYALEADERVLSTTEVLLSDEIGARPEPVIVVGTGYVTCRGEDFQPKGRILVFRVSSATVNALGDGGAAENGEGENSASAAAANSESMTTVPKLRLLHATDLRGPATAVSPLTTSNRDRTHVVCMSGRRVQVFEWQASMTRLRLIGYWEAQAWGTSLSVVKEFVLAGDNMAGLAFLRWREEDRQLHLLGHDVTSLPVEAVSLIVHEKRLGLVGVDRQGNVTIEGYTPRETQSKLSPLADTHLNAGVSAPAMIRTRASFPIGTPAIARRRHGTLVSQHDGTIGMIFPTEEDADYKRLITLSRVLVYCLPHPAGTNPKTYRSYSCPTVQPLRHRIQGKSAIVDGCLLSRYTTLATSTQIAMTDAVGTTPDRVLSNIRSLDASATVC